jgi:nucleoside-triphosphatase
MGRMAPAVNARAFLLTGRPGSGKTTCIRRVVESLARPAAGFVTEEVRRAGTRIGFNLVTLDGRSAMIARVGTRGGPRVGKYVVDVEALDRVGVPAVRAAIERGAVAVIDEIGKMELASAAFRQVVEETLATDVPVLATIMLASHPWADAVKRRADVELIEVTPATRDALPDRLRARLEHGRR